MVHCRSVPAGTISSLARARMLTETHRRMVRRNDFRVMDALLLVVFVKERAPKPRLLQSGEILSRRGWQHQRLIETRQWSRPVCSRLALAGQLCHAPLA